MDDVTSRAILLLLLTAGLVASGHSAQAGGTHVMRLAPVQDVSLPFWCDWGYDWDERCYRDDGDRLPIGGEADKLWRAGLRFPTPSLPSGSTVVGAQLKLYHDGRCLGARKTVQACTARPYELEAHPILSTDWFDERELDFGPALSGAELESATEPKWLSFDVTDLVAEWADGSRRNSGVLLKLADWHEDYDVSGPSMPSSTFALPAVRPQLEIAYVPSNS
jgi:hypothetical protein